jgi:hypothetical protein
VPSGIYDPARTLLVTAAEVRNFTGYTASADIGDSEIQQILRHGQALLIGKITANVDSLELEGPINGTNAKFRVPDSVRGRVFFDDVLDAGLTGVLIQLRTDTTDGSPPTYTTATVTALDSLNGIVTLSAAPASTVDAVLFTGRLTSRRFDKELLKTAILCQASLAVDVRVREHGKVHLTNPEASRKGGIASGSGGRRGLWEDMLEDAMRSLRKLMPQKAAVDTRLHASTRVIPTDP